MSSRRASNGRDIGLSKTTGAPEFAGPNAGYSSTDGVRRLASTEVSGFGQRLSSRFDDLLFLALVAGLACAPFWLGSNRPLAWGVNAVYFGALALLYEISLVVTRRRHPIAVSRIWFPALAFLVLCAWAIIQMIPSNSISFQHPIWQMAGEKLGRDLAGSISVNRDKTVIAITRFATCGMAFWVSLQLCRSATRARRLVKAIAVIGVLYALYGIVTFFLFPGTVPWFEGVKPTDGLTSTFVNRNSYATYAGIGMVAAFGLALSHFLRGADSKGASLGHRIAALAALTVGEGAGWIVCVFVIGIALVLTGSRGGVSATIAGVVSLALLVGARARKNPVGMGFGLLSAGLAIGVALFAYGDFLTERLATGGVSSNARLATYALTLRSIMHAPLLGFGDGTFANVFPMYRDSSIGPQGVWDMAHNTYLELFQGLGAPVAVMYLVSLLFLAGRCVYATLTRLEP